MADTKPAALLDRPRSVASDGMATHASTAAGPEAGSPPSHDRTARIRRPASPSRASSSAPRRCARCRGRPGSPQPLQQPARRRAAARRGRRGGRARDPRRPAPPPAAQLPRAQRRQRGRELRIGEQATILVEVRSSKLRPTRRRNLTILEAKVADESGPLTRDLVQPGLARRQARARRAAAAPRQARQAGLQGRRPRAPRRPRRRGCPTGLHTTGHRARASRRPRRIKPAAHARVGVAGARPRRATRSSRCRRALRVARAAPGRRRRAGRGPLSRARSRGRGRSRAARLRGAVALPGRARAAPQRSAREPPGRPARAGPASWSQRWLESLPFELTARPAPGDRRDRRRPRAERADAAAADGRGRLGQDGASRSTRCCAPSRAAIRRR